MGIHTHDDAGCGVANSLVAVQAGATLVQGTMNGYGERCGNANLVSIIPALQLKIGHDVHRAPAPARLTEIAHLVDEICNVTPGPEPAVRGPQRVRPQGRHARGGVRQDAAPSSTWTRRRSATTARLLISELSGAARCRRAERRAGRLRRRRGADRDALKELEHRGYQFEAADGSFDLLIRKETGDYEPLFRLESWRVIVEKREDGRVQTEATIKIWVDGRRYVRTAEGNGPVNALDRALRDAIVETYPHLARHRAGELQGEDPRRDEGDRGGHARAARRQRRRRHLGLDRRL